MIHSIVQWIVRVFILFCIFSLSGCAVFESKSISDCHFKYTDDIKKEVIVPFLTEKVSRGMVKYFNVDKPVISEKKDKTRVVLSAINSVNGQMVMF